MKIIECPRDAMQGLEEFIPTETKVAYINQLLKVGFDTLDFGSFVSHQAIPQMRDTDQVLRQLDFGGTKTSLLAIVANARGAQQAGQFEKIKYLGFPLSISETFQRRNTNKSIGEALNAIADIQDICKATGKSLVTYVSMAFGNPYNDPFNDDLVTGLIDILATMDVGIVSLADTIGISKPAQVRALFSTVTARFPELELGAHLHSSQATALEKIEAAFEAGCKRFDGALRGYGGCPMADDKLVGNVATETILGYLNSKNSAPQLSQAALQEAMRLADSIFPK